MLYGNLGNKIKNKLSFSLDVSKTIKYQWFLFILLIICKNKNIRGYITEYKSPLIYLLW